MKLFQKDSGTWVNLDHMDYFKVDEINYSVKAYKIISPDTDDKDQCIMLKLFNSKSQAQEFLDKLMESL